MRKAISKSYKQMLEKVAEAQSYNENIEKKIGSLMSTLDHVERSGVLKDNQAIQSYRNQAQQFGQQVQSSHDKVCAYCIVELYRFFLDHFQLVLFLL